MAKERDTTKDKDVNAESDTSTKSRSNNNRKSSGRGNRGNGGRSGGKTHDSFKGGGASNPTVALTATQLITSANLGYGYPLGTSIDDAATLKGAVPASSLGVPSIAAYYVHPHIGRSRDASSKVNLAAHRLYTSFVYANGRSPAYDVPDAIMSPLAVGQAASFYHFAVRCYKTMNTFLTDNRSVPRALAKLQLIDYDDFKENLADFAHWLEDYRLMLKTLFLPGNLPIIDEWCSAYDDVYLDDAENPKAQMFLYVPEGFYRYDPTGSETGGRLVWVPYAVAQTAAPFYNVYTYAQFKTLGQSLLDVLVYDQDINKIQADIMLSYGPESVADVFPVALGEPLEFKTDAIVMATLHNAVSFGGLTQVGTTISQDANGCIIYDPHWDGNKQNCMPLIGAKFLDSPTSDVNPVLNLLMSRMIALAPVISRTADTIVTDPGYYFAVDSAAGSVHPSALGVFTISEIGIVKTVGNSSTPGDWSVNFLYNTPPMTDAGAIQWFNNFQGSFKLFPTFEKYKAMGSVALKSATSPAAFTLESIFGEIGYYTIVEESTIKQILDTYIFANLSAGLKG